jgi:hypothetical protein
LSFGGAGGNSPENWNVKIWIKILLAFLVLCRSGQAQGFVNLNFEQAAVSHPPGLNYDVYASNAIPGWTAYFNGSPQSIIGYDTINLDEAGIFLEDSNAPAGSGLLPIQGNYSVLLQASSFAIGHTVSIGQTGTIPSTAQSLTFFGSLAANTLGENLQLTFNGQALSFMAISNALNYTVYEAGISPFAGQTGQLLFTAPVQTFALLDNIQFSSTAVPEPSELALGALGALLLGFRRWKKSS